MTIDFLLDFPDYIPTLAEKIHAQWGHLNPNSTLETIRRKLESQKRDALPLTLVAHAGGVPLGTASLIEDDMSTRPDLTPWLASVLVFPEHRHSGVGSALVRGIMETARARGTKVFYLWTPDKEKFYAKLGWEKLCLENYLGLNNLVVMRHVF